MRALFFCLFLLISITLSAQDFDTFFNNQTLRINYHHIGNKNQEKIEIKDFFAQEEWSGTRAYLLEPNRHGDVLFEAFDAETNTPIYSRSYSCLFNEYRTTLEGETIIDTFEECITMPMPKKSIKYCFSSFDRYKKQTKIYEGNFNPNIDPITVGKDDNQYNVIDLHIGGDSKKCLDILFIPDGYSKQDKELLANDMKRFCSYVMNCEPYKSMADKVNIRAIEGYSEESGITDPRKNIERNTLINSRYNVINVDRYLMCLNVWKMNAIADNAPHDVIVIVANSSKYGGGGIFNFYATVNNIGQYSDYVIVHELGHLIGGLADEYYTSEVSVRDYYPEGIEPIEPNLTTLVDFDSKWKSMLDKDTPIPTPATFNNSGKLGVYEGGGYVAKGVYRPVQSCTMKDIKYNYFCPVCKQTLIKVINYYANQPLEE